MWKARTRGYFFLQNLRKGKNWEIKDHGLGHHRLLSNSKSQPGAAKQIKIPKNTQLPEITIPKNTQFWKEFTNSRIDDTNN